MRAMLLHGAPRGKISVENVPDAKLSDDNAVIVKVKANGMNGMAIGDG
jgi:threonine dehydrogenase-like Zn-dependent dehydrogenase